MTVATLEVLINAKLDQFERDIKDAKGELEGLRKEADASAKEVERGMRVIDRSAGVAQDAVSKLARETALAGDASAEAAAKYEATSGALKDLTESQKLAVVMQARARDEAVRGAERQAAAARMAKQSQDAAAKSIDAYRRETALAGNATAEAAAKYEVASGSLRDLTAAEKGAVVQAARLRDAQLELVAAQGRVQGAMAAAPAAMGRFGTALTMGLTLPLAGAVAASAKAAMGVESSVARIRTLRPDIDKTKLFATLNEMQTRIPQTAQELGDGLYDIFSSVDATMPQATRLLETYAKGAVAAGTDSQTFGSAISGVLNAYKLNLDDAAMVSDRFFYTVNKGVVNGGELARGLGIVTASAKAAGTGLDEMMVLAAAVTKEGGPAEQNLNNLANLFNKITTAESRKEIEKLGVATATADGKFRPVAKVLEDLKAKLDRMPQAVKAAKLQDIFPDAQARQGAQTLMSQLDFVQKGLEEITSSAGSTDRAWKIMSESTEKRVQLLINKFTAAGAAIGEKLLPRFEKLADKLEDGIEWWDALSESTKGVYLTWAGAGAAAGPLLAAIAGGVKAVQAMQTAHALMRIAKIADDNLMIASSGRLTAAIGVSRLAFLGLAAVAAVSIGGAYTAVTGLRNDAQRAQRENPRLFRQYEDSVTRRVADMFEQETRNGGTRGAADRVREHLRRGQHDLPIQNALRSLDTVINAANLRAAQERERNGGGSVQDQVGAAIARKMAGPAPMFGVGIPADKAGLKKTKEAETAWKAEIKALAKEFGLRVTSELRPGARTTNGKRSLHADGLALDIGGRSRDGSLKTAEMAAFFREVQRRYPGGIKELIYSPLGEQFGNRTSPVVTNAERKRNHYNHVHVALRAGATAAYGSAEGGPAYRDSVRAAPRKAGPRQDTLTSRLGDLDSILGLGLGTKAYQVAELRQKHETMIKTAMAKVVRETALLNDPKRVGIAEMFGVSVPELKEIRKVDRPAYDRMAVAYKAAQDKERAKAETALRTKSQDERWEAEQASFFANKDNPTFVDAARKARSGELRGGAFGVAAQLAQARAVGEELKAWTEETSGLAQGTIWDSIAKGVAALTAETRKAEEGGFDEYLRSLAGRQLENAGASRAAAIALELQGAGFARNAALMERAVAATLEVERVERFREQMRGIADDVSGVLVGAVRDMDGTFSGLFRNVSQGFSRMVFDMTMQWAQSRLQGAIFGGLTSLLGGGAKGKPTAAGIAGAVGAINFRAVGGMMSRGVPHVVGERGPEVVVPQVASYVHTAGASERMLGGTTVVVNMTVSTPNPDAFRASEGQIVGGLTTAIQRKVQRG